MEPLLFHLLGQLGQGLQDRKAHGQALDGGGNVLLHSARADQVLPARNHLGGRIVELLKRVIKRLLFGQVCVVAQRFA